jgi:methylmalonyl-CoA/ethylmalonyl-CoA epimerase
VTPSVDEDLSSIVERFDHVSMAVTSFDDASPLIDLIGGRYVDGGYEDASDFHWVQYDLPHWGRLEMIRTDSRDPEHFINRFIGDRGEGLHHLTFKVSDIAAAVGKAEGLGFTVVGFDASNPGWKEAFVHPRSANGVLIQLAEFADKDPHGGS